MHAKPENRPIGAPVKRLALCAIFLAIAALDAFNAPPAHSGQITLPHPAVSAQNGETLQRLIGSTYGLECSTFEVWQMPDASGLVAFCKVDDSSTMVTLPRDNRLALGSYRDAAAFTKAVFGRTLIDAKVNSENGALQFNVK